MPACGPQLAAIVPDNILWLLFRVPYPLHPVTISLIEHPMVGTTMSAEERRLALMWHAEDGLSPKEIAARLRRDKSTLTRFLVKGHVGPGRGKPRLLAPSDIVELVTVLERLIKEADGRYEVTVRDLKARSGVSASEKTIARALHSQNIYFRPLRQKPLITAADNTTRKAFTHAYADKPRSWWLRHIHMHIDVKHFPVLLHHGPRHHGLAEAPVVPIVPRAKAWRPRMSRGAAA